MVLARFLDAADAATDLQHVGSTGEVDLSAPALVAICGPKSSPTIRALIAADPAFDFSADPDGRWRIIDRVSERVYASPVDDDPNADRDVAYLGRLPRTGDTAPMPVIAGVHAVGSLGAMRYLTTTTNLRELHRAVGQACLLDGHRVEVRRIAAEDPVG